MRQLPGFVRTASRLAALAWLSLAAPVPSAHQATPPLPAPRIAVLFEQGFPAVDVEPVPEAALRDALVGLDATFVSVDRLAADLDTARVDVLVTPFGSAFPVDAWPAMLRFLRAGGSWVNLGGRPLSVPVYRGASGGWQASHPSTAYLKALGFTHLFEVPAGSVSTWRTGDGVATDSPLARGFRADTIYEADIRLANTKDFPDEDGSDGAREGRLRALVVGLDAKGTPIAAPFVRIDRTAGAYAGGAWLLANLKGSIAPGAIRALVDEAVTGAVEFVARPTSAGYLPGEVPAIEVQVHRPGRRAPGAVRGKAVATVIVTDAAGRIVASAAAPLAAAAGSAAATVPLTGIAGTSARGLFSVRVVLAPESEAAAKAVVLPEATTGFWIYEPSMLEGGTPLAVDKDMFTRGGQPFPVTGTTYMASDVHRRFLLEPNPSLWNHDFAAMKAAGVNLVRTGIWTGWKRYMPEVGTWNEAALRSLDVFLLTARQHDIPVVFTLFAFLPEAWGGENPFLDARAVSAQQAFAGTLARRYATVNDLSWDLINEPSFSSPSQLWSTRPNYDASETAAWQRWLRERYGTGGADAVAAAHQAWRTRADEGSLLPALDDFTDRNLLGSSRPLKAADYRFFAQDMFTRWTRQMIEALRRNGNTAQLVTVGQDEGGLTERPNPLFFGRAVDYTCIHTWWNNDALAWDAVLSKRPDRPLLVEETGLMRYERADGAPWRTEADASRLLERKLALAFATGGAGYVQWIWNTNPYMDSDNEAGIGFFRADGTARPELAPFVAMSGFLRAHASHFRGRVAEDVALLIPHSQMFSVRTHAIEATQRAVRVLTNHLHVPVRAVGEYALGDTLGAPRLIIAPSPRVLSDRAWLELLSAVDRGATLVVSGIIDADERWLPAGRSRALGLTAASRPVAGEESLVIDGQVHRLGYRGDKLERLDTASVAGEWPAAVHVIRRGRGTILWAPAPVELAQSPDATVALYALALRHAGVRPPVTVGPADPGVFVGCTTFADAILVALVSESGGDRDLRVSGVPVRLAAGRTALLLFARRDGRLIAQWERE